MKICEGCINQKKILRQIVVKFSNAKSYNEKVANELQVEKQQGDKEEVDDDKEIGHWFVYVIDNDTEDSGEAATGESIKAEKNEEGIAGNSDEIKEGMIKVKGESDEGESIEAEENVEGIAEKIRISEVQTPGGYAKPYSLALKQLPAHDEDLTAQAVQGIKEDLLDKTVKLNMEYKTSGKSFVPAHVGDEDIGKDTGDIRFDGRELTKFGGDLFNGSLHGADEAELMMDDPNIGKSNEEINTLGEIEVEMVEDANANIEEGLEMDYDPHSKAIVNVCKDEDIGEIENDPSDSPMNEEEMEVTSNVVDFFYAGKVGFRSKVSKKLVDIYGMGKFEFDSLASKIKGIVDTTLKSDGLKEGKNETIEVVVNLRNKTVLVKDAVHNKSTVNGFNSTAFVENKEFVDVASQEEEEVNHEEEKDDGFDRILKEKKGKDIAEVGLGLRKEESIRNVCINVL